MAVELRGGSGPLWARNKPGCKDLLVLQVKPAAPESGGRHTAPGAWRYAEIRRSANTASSNGTQDFGQQHHAL